MADFDANQVKNEKELDESSQMMEEDKSRDQLSLPIDGAARTRGFSIVSADSEESTLTDKSSSLGSSTATVQKPSPSKRNIGEAPETLKVPPRPESTSLEGGATAAPTKTSPLKNILDKCKGLFGKGAEASERPPEMGDKNAFLAMVDLTKAFIKRKTTELLEPDSISLSDTSSEPPHPLDTPSSGVLGDVSDLSSSTMTESSSSGDLDAAKPVVLDPRQVDVSRMAPLVRRVQENADMNGGTSAEEIQSRNKDNA